MTHSYRRLWVLVPGILLVVGLAGCGPKIQDYSYLAPAHYPPKAKDATVAVFVLPDMRLGDKEKANLPAQPGATIADLDVGRPYEVIAYFQVSRGITGGTEDAARKRARKLGGDAVAIQFVSGFLGAGYQRVFVLCYE